MSSDYWEKLQHERVKNLEERQEQLRKENALFKAPDVNRMVAEKLNTTSQGCNCQRMLLILVQDGELKATEYLSPIPFFLKEAKADEEKNPWEHRYGPTFDKVGEAYYTKRFRDDFYEKDFDPDLAGIKRYPKLVPTLMFGDKQYYQDPCTYSDDLIIEELESSYSCPEEISELPDGIYHVLWENACYTYTTMEGDEGDSETDFKIYPSVPLWDFLRYKEEMIAEATPEGQELAAAYLYIQETKQNRKKSVEKTDDYTLDYYMKNDKLPTENPLLAGNLSTVAANFILDDESEEDDDVANFGLEELLGDDHETNR